MVVVSRYSSGGDESDILKNKMGITDVEELDTLPNERVRFIGAKNLNELW